MQCVEDGAKTSHIMNAPPPGFVIILTACARREMDIMAPFSMLSQMRFLLLALSEFQN